MQKRLFFFMSFMVITTERHADIIQVHNKTTEDLFVAVYYEKKDTALRVGDLLVIKTGSSQSLERPARKFGYDRELYAAQNQDALVKNLTNPEIQKLTSVNVGDTQGSNFYFARDKDGILKGFNTVEWKVVQPALEKLSALKNQVSVLMTNELKAEIKNQFRVIRENPYKETTAQVRYGNDLCEKEVAYLQKRKPKVKAALEKITGLSITDAAVPTIALIESGGGYRAMASSIGHHVGLAQIGLIDAVTYAVGLSGSTWSIALWLQSSLPINKFQEQILPKMQESIEKITADELSLLATGLLAKQLYDQDITSVDLYGGLLANRLLSGRGQERQRTFLSTQGEIIAQGSWPFPIYTAVSGDKGLAQDWYEITPFEVGGSWLGVYVPTWAFGRKFSKGVSVDFAPEQTLGYFMGVFGSAFSANVNQIIDQLKIKKTKLSAPLQAVFNAILDEIGDNRLSSATVYNFASGIERAQTGKFERIDLVDAGLEFNLPYPPVSGERASRKADIMIIMDASAGGPGKELAKTEAYARKKRLKFPVISYEGIESRAVSLFKDESDPEVPLIIYLPLVNDAKLRAQAQQNPQLQYFGYALKDFDVKKCIQKDFCNTFNFSYSLPQAKQLSGLAEFNVVASKDLIIDAITWKIKQRMQS